MQILIKNAVTVFYVDFYDKTIHVGLHTGHLEVRYKFRRQWGRPEGWVDYKREDYQKGGGFQKGLGGGFQKGLGQQDGGFGGNKGPFNKGWQDYNKGFEGGSQ